MLTSQHGLGLAIEESFAAPAGRAKNAMLEIEFAQLSDNGRTRDHNEDYLGYVSPATPEQARTHGWLFALADGVGGQAHGEVASREAVECLLAGFREAPVAEAPLALLTRLVKAANTHVFNEAHEHSQEGSGMATTLVACALRYDRAAVAHVGDSRCYLVRRGHAHALTRDHTLANEQLRMGMLTEREAANADHRHLLVRSVGSDMFVNPEVSDHQVFTGDVLVLCSDGLHGSVTGGDLGRIAGPEVDLNAAATKLVELANERDGSDNISVQLIRVRSVERVGMYRGRPYRLPG
jgi:serine/threonine protein phosphatase PrpC